MLPDRRHTVSFEKIDALGIIMSLYCSTQHCTLSGANKIPLSQAMLRVFSTFSSINMRLYPLRGQYLMNPTGLSASIPYLRWGTRIKIWGAGTKSSEVPGVDPRNLASHAPTRGLPR